MNMDALDFDGDMWDPEYCDSELRAVEASGESRDELCLYRQTQLKLNRRLTGGNVTRVTIAWQWPSDAMDFSGVIYSVGNELLIDCIPCFVIQQPTMFTI